MPRVAGTGHRAQGTGHSGAGGAAARGPRGARGGDIKRERRPAIMQEALERLSDRLACGGRRRKSRGDEDCCRSPTRTQRGKAPQSGNTDNLLCQGVTRRLNNLPACEHENVTPSTQLQDINNNVQAPSAQPPAPPARANGASGAQKKYARTPSRRRTLAPPVRTTANACGRWNPASAPSAEDTDAGGPRQRPCSCGRHADVTAGESAEARRRSRVPLALVPPNCCWGNYLYKAPAPLARRRSSESRPRRREASRRRALRGAREVAAGARIRPTLRPTCTEPSTTRGGGGPASVQASAAASASSWRGRWPGRPEASPRPAAPERRSFRDSVAHHAARSAAHSRPRPQTCSGGHEG
ncbi:serine/arginine repetitive matrix protein 1-like [Penaeus chinensis]|uniref:serine/arginine repetitive matrix protein 1-like n=1 Tax=Penaeus chinensis TaxID=139456 RepID=UPI001FB5F3B2|nr:serine/arginine repetitive matrix protein 1-like [Penaeus chinensis]